MGHRLATFLVVVFATFFNGALHLYTRVRTCPLFARVGREELVPFHEECQRRLPVAIYAPRLPADGVQRAAVLPPAAPVHHRMDRQTGNDNGEVRRLIRLPAYLLVRVLAA